MSEPATPWRNEVIGVADLPAVDDAAFEPLERRYLHQQRALWCFWIGLLVVAGAVLVIVLGAPTWVWLPVIGGPAAVASLAWVLEGLAYAHRGVQLRERDVSSRRGLIARTTVSVPFTRVQHVTVERSFTDRLFGLSTVVIYTAGAMAADAQVTGLAPERADRLREGIINRSNRDAPPADERPD